MEKKYFQHRLGQKRGEDEESLGINIKNQAKQRKEGGNMTETN